MCTLRLISILPDISAPHHLQLKCMGGHFCPCRHPYIESTTILSDIRTSSSNYHRHIDMLLGGIFVAIFVKIWGKYFCDQMLSF